MKKIRRMFAIVFLIAFLTLIGYLNFSGSRFFKSGEMETYKGHLFYAETEEVFLSIDEELATVYGIEGEEYYLDLESFEDGILTFTDGTNHFQFFLLGEEAVYDAERKLILYATS